MRKINRLNQLKFGILFISLLTIFFVSLSNARSVSKAPVNTVAVMAPLYIDSHSDMKEFEKLLQKAASIGVNAVTVDVWWGIVESAGDQQFDWSYYDTVFQKIRAQNLKIIPIMSFHKCGGGPGDNCNIPLPIWLKTHFESIGITNDDLMYESETGKKQDDSIAPWATSNPVVLQQFSEFMQAFTKQFGILSNDFVELNISLGPTGELRYPAYNKSDGWGYPDRGNFQAYSQLARSHFQNWTVSRFGGVSGVSSRWGIPISDASNIRPPGGHLPPLQTRRAQDFVERQDYKNLQYGQDFISWYQESLIGHGKRLLLAANNSLDGLLSGIPLGMKLPGVHWQIKCSKHPRIAEITAGLVATNLDLRTVKMARKDSFGYKNIMKMLSQVKKAINRDVILHFTALEMDNDPGCVGTSMAEELVFWISQGASDYGITHKGENALACINGSEPQGSADDRSWQHIRNIFTHAPYQGFTMLRLTSDGCNPWTVDNNYYARFISDFVITGKPLTIHLAEWQSCFISQDCSYDIYTFKGLSGNFEMRYEGFFNNRHWWVGQIAKAPDNFSFTFKNSNGWEGNPGQFNRTYNRDIHGNDIFIIGRGNSSAIYTERP